MVKGPKTIAPLFLSCRLTKADIPLHTHTHSSAIPLNRAVVQTPAKPTPFDGGGERGKVSYSVFSADSVPSTWNTCNAAKGGIMLPILQIR